MANTRFLLATAIMYLLQTNLTFAAEIFSVNTTGEPPLSSPQHDGYQNLIAIELFARLGQKFVMHFLPAKRSLINLNSGIDDATISRGRGIEKSYPNVRIVPEKVLDAEFVAITKSPNIELNGWDDLEPYSIGYIRGWVIFEQNAKNSQFVTKVTDSTQLFDLLAAGRADVVLFEKWEGLNILKQRKMKDARILSPPLAVEEFFMYVHKKHETLVGTFANTLRTMKSDGTFKRIYEKTLAPLTAN